MSPQKRKMSQTTKEEDDSKVPEKNEEEIPNDVKGEGSPNDGENNVEGKTKLYRR